MKYINKFLKILILIIFAIIIIDISFYVYAYITPKFPIYTNNNITIYIANNLNITKMTHNKPKLKECKKITFNLEKDKDIVIEDLCFIKFTKKGKVDIYTKYDINIYERNNLI